VSLSLTDNFQNSIKTRIKLYKSAYRIIRKLFAGVGVGWGKGVEMVGRGRRENRGESAMVVGG